MKNVKLQHFRDAMKDFSEDFILIGGNACALLFDSVGAEFRETADLDVVLVIEKWSNEFAATLDQYIEEFGYTGRRFIRGDTVEQVMFIAFQLPLLIQNLMRFQVKLSFFLVVQMVLLLKRISI